MINWKKILYGLKFMEKIGEYPNFNLNISAKYMNNLEKIIKGDLYVKGRKCSEEGKKYEHIVYNVTSKLKNINNNIKFNTQKINELGGCSPYNDMICNFNDYKDTCIEIKK